MVGLSSIPALKPLSQIPVPFDIGFPSHRDIDRAVHEPMKLILPKDH
jgi:hypothetical protein